MDPENQNFEKMKKIPQDIIILQMCTINDSRAVWFLSYGVQWTECFCQFGPFLPFYSPNNPKNQNLKKMKKPPGDIITLHMCTINGNHMTYGS